MIEAKGMRLRSWANSDESSKGGPLYSAAVKRLERERRRRKGVIRKAKARQKGQSYNCDTFDLE
jgi:hypothetical protein